MPYVASWDRHQRPNNFPEALKDEVWERDGGRCVYCGRFGGEVDHVVPASAGGPPIRANAVLSCSPCNRKKRNRITITWLYLGFFHLLEKHESLAWVDTLWSEKLSELQKARAKLAAQSTLLQSYLQDRSLEETEKSVTSLGDRLLIMELMQLETERERRILATIVQFARSNNGWVSTQDIYPLLKQSGIPTSGGEVLSLLAHQTLLRRVETGLYQLVPEVDLFPVSDDQGIG